MIWLQFFNAKFFLKVKIISNLTKNDSIHKIIIQKMTTTAIDALDLIDLFITKQKYTNNKFLLYLKHWNYYYICKIIIASSTFISFTFISFTLQCSSAIALRILFRKHSDNEKGVERILKANCTQMVNWCSWCTNFASQVMWRHLLLAFVCVTFLITN